MTNWNLLLLQAKARQKALEGSTAVLTAATDEAANTLEKFFDGQNDYDEGGEEEEVEEVEEEEVQTQEEAEQTQGQEKSNGKRKYKEMAFEKYELPQGNWSVAILVLRLFLTIQDTKANSLTVATLKMYVQILILTNVFICYVMYKTLLFSNGRAGTVKGYRLLCSCRCVPANMWL
ncbi:hypothetical protein MFLAVUS_007129 [Mucor flavus]|uniref:Uncharacterized protein n=1 Tax=Mucor flavus TaxID=439312 RepID=A0ABP9Z3F9_9FUNG